MTAKKPDPTDTNSDPSKDPEFLDAVDTAKDNADRDNPRTPPRAEVGLGGPEINNGYAGTGKTADELVALYGTNPDGSPRTEPAPTGPSCPPVSPDGYPFDTTAIPAGLSAPLTAECAAYYNDLYKPTDAAVGSFAKK